ncbi:MAG TPA: redoxin domain-containing protein [bacterium]|nr:redoxin domain-containing protein [Candidatus Omnitrophota bacterium]HOJ59649.1 redoxin domain-containing protein [bacterium]HPP00400.1 redoxin domain-containing protein [bacterium]
MKSAWNMAVFAVLIGALTVSGAAMAAEEVKPYKVGDEVAAFELKDVNGKTHNLADLLGEKIIVLDFWNCQCPVSVGFESQLMGIAGKYEGKDVVFLAIDSNHNNSEELIKKYAEDKKLNYPVLKDVDNVIADRFGAERTPEVFVIGKDKKIHYHGAITDNQNADKVKNHYLVAALDAMLAGKEVETKETNAFGCTIKRVEK